MYSIYYQDYYVDMGVHKNKYLASVTSSTQDSIALKDNVKDGFRAIPNREAWTSNYETTQTNEVDQLYNDCY